MSNFANQANDGLMSFLSVFNTLSKRDMDRQELEQAKAINQARLDQMAYERQRQEKSDWQQSYDKGMDELANAALLKYASGQQPDVDQSVLRRIDPSKIMAVDEMRRKRVFEDSVFGGGQSPGLMGGPVKTSQAPTSPTISPSAATAPAGQVKDLVDYWSRWHGMNPADVYPVAQVESGFQQTDPKTGKILTSSAGALGAMQLMPGTAKDMGVNPADVSDNVNGGVKYLKQMSDRFGGDLNKAYRAYNGGPGGVDSPATAPYADKVMALRGQQVAQAGQTTVSDASGKPPAAQAQPGYGGRLQDLIKLPPEQFAKVLVAAPKEYRDTLTTMYKMANPESTALKEFDAYTGMDPQKQEEFAKFKRLSKPETNVNIDGGKKFQQTLGELWAKDYQKMFDDASGAQSVRDNVQAAKQLFAGGLQTGALEPAKAQVSALAQSIGVDPNKLGLPDASDAQKFNAVVMKNLLAELVAQKGPQTEGDASRALKTFAQLGNTPEANQFALDYADAVAQRKQDMANYVYQVGRENYEGDSFKAKSDWQKKINGTPLFATSPNTGKPVTYYQYKESALANGVAADQIDNAWKDFVGKK
jgi:soluble lytic murein transglycosylase-like protein